MQSGVYIIVNIASDGIYVGSTRDFSDRWRRHKNQLRAGTHHCLRLQRAWHKYGSGAFLFEIVERVSEDQLYDREQHHLDKRVKSGTAIYNGNLTVTPCVTFTAKVRRKMSMSHQGKRRSVESIRSQQKTLALSRPIFTIRSPDGKLHRGRSIRGFARKHGLSASVLGLVLRGKLRHHRGWYRPNARIKV